MIICPKCGSKNTAPIVYGYPGGEMFEEAQQNKIILGGCCVTNYDDDYGCFDCDFQWSKDKLDTKYVKKITIKIWRNGLCDSNELKKHCYDIYPDGRVKYYAYKGEALQSDETKETSVFAEMVNKLHKEAQQIIAFKEGMLSYNVCDGTSYSLSISYKDNRRTYVKGSLVGYPLDVLITEFIDKIQF